MQYHKLTSPDESPWAACVQKKYFTEEKFSFTNRPHPQTTNEASHADVCNSTKSLHFETFAKITNQDVNSENLKLIFN